MKNKKIEELISYIIKTENLNSIKKHILHFHPYDLSQCFLKLDDDNREKLYSVLTDEQLADIFSYIEVEDTAGMFEEITDIKAASIINEMEPDDAADLMAEIDEEKAEAIYNLLDKESFDDIKELSSYDEDIAGSIMNSNFIMIESGSDIKEIMKLIVQKAPDVETINTSFVVNKDGYLLGTLDLKKIIVTKSPCIVDDIMNTNYQSVNVNDDLETVLKVIGDYDIYDMPVLEKGILKGIITMDDALENLIEEAEEDYAKFAGLTDSERYEESTFESVKKRLPWLSILLVMGIFISIVISSFDYLFEIESLTVLVIFQPIILGLAGNSGTQSLAITIRKIAKDELEMKSEVFKHLVKEILLGIVSGLILGILAFILSTLLLYLRKDFDNSIFQVGFIVGFSIFTSLTAANIFGSLIPIIFYKIKIDPAVASGPFITTLIDIISVLIYFTLATILIYNHLT